MKWVPGGPERNGRSQLAIVLAVALITSLIAIMPALAAHPLASLTGSNFEIDENANLKLDDGAPKVDWGSLAHPNGPELRATDLATGQNDNSYKGGVKEDTECPAETTGSIPNNKSDLLTFHVYEEPGSPGFLNLAWSRVSDPSGTTLMDFEFNQSTTDCPQGPNVVRTPGDLLIEYAIDQGGARAEISGRFWVDSDWESPEVPGDEPGSWGPVVDLDDGTDCDGGPCAVGTINQTTILATDSDGLGEKQARTFGEAQIDLDLIFEEGKCTSFGSAMLKSRSSDAFTSQLKDFISPIPIDLQNCGNVIIRKQTDPDEDPNSTTFGYTKSFATDPVSDNTFTLTDDGVKNYNDTVLFGSGYTVTEDVIPAGWDFVSVNCSASTGVTPSIVGATVTFAIDADTDVLDCTYTNRARGSIIVEKITNDGTGAFSFTSSTLSPSPFILTTTAAGAAGKDSETFTDLSPGTYDVAETVPANWNLVSSTCDDGSDPASIGLSGGETVTCTFINEIERGAIEITKTRKHADPAGSDNHEGVTFTITHPNGTDIDVVTGADGKACVGGLPVSALSGTDYTVTETVPAGYVADGSTAKTVTVDEGTCAGTPNTVSFSNTPKTDVSIEVDSQVDGGTSTVVACWVGDIDDEDESGTIDVDDADYVITTDPASPDFGDGTLSITDLLPTDPDATLTCTITIDP